MTATKKAVVSLLSDLPDDTEVLCHVDKVIEDTDPHTGEKMVAVIDEVYNIKLFVDVDHVSGKQVIVVYPLDKA